MSIAERLKDAVGVLEALYLSKSTPNAKNIEQMVVRLVLRVAAFVPELLDSPAADSPDCIGHLTEALLHLRYSCSYGAAVRLALAKTESLAPQHIATILLNNDAYSQRPAQLCWQMLINNSYDEQSGDTTTARLLWAAHSATILTACSVANYAHAELCRMFVYKMLLDGHTDVGQTEQLLKVFVNQYRGVSEQTIPEHLQFILEFYACRCPDVLPAYAQLDATERVAFLQFVADVLREAGNEDQPTYPPISSELVLHMCREFKLKSDCVLKTEASYADRVHPHEVYALLEVISTLSADFVYAAELAIDHSLFLNAGCLLSSIAALGAKTENIFTPVSKLAQIAPNSTERNAIQQDVSYDLKSMLVRTIGNLAYRNARNQELAREMDILVAVLNCTSVDARNPLIKEWSVLAIRNLCDRCPENQALVRSLTKVGEADNSDVLKEFNLELGSMRIGGK